MPKLIRPVVVLIIGILFGLSAAAQTNGTVSVKPVSNTIENGSGANDNKAAAATLNTNKVKTVDKKKRKPTHVTTIKKPVNSIQNTKK